MRESLYTRVIIWVNIILNQIGTRAILPRFEGSFVHSTQIRVVLKQNFGQIHIPCWYSKCEILIMDSRMVFEKRNIIMIPNQ